jgi:hypothetical protein
MWWLNMNPIEQKITVEKKILCCEAAVIAQLF